MADTTETQARTAERTLTAAVAAVRTTVTMTPQTAVHLETVRAATPQLAGSAESVLSELEQRRGALAALPDCVAAPSAPDTLAVRHELSERADALRAQADAVDAGQFTVLLSAAVSGREALEARRLLAEHRGVVAAERDRRRERALLDAARDETVTTE